MRTRNRRVAVIGLKDAGRNRVVYIDSFSNKALGSEVLQRRHALVEFSERLHNELASGARGATLNGVGGALLFVLSVTGIVLWWPGRKNWKRGLKVKWNARWARRNWDLHSAFGFWSLLFVAMWGLSGCYFVFPKPFTGLIAHFSSMSHLRDAPSNWNVGEEVLPVDWFIGKAKQMYPGDELAYFYMDVYRPHNVVKAFLSSNPARSLSLLEDVVTFQPATGSILSNISSAN